MRAGARTNISMWQSSVDRQVIVSRGQLLSDIRAFFAARQVIEVDVPLLGRSTVTDVHLSAPVTQISGHDYYLQTSPEFFMKRLLAGGSGSIYYLGKAVRNDESGPRHNPEFTMLEWYREGFSDIELMDEVEALFRQLSIVEGVESVSRISYREAFESYVGVDPHVASADELASVAKSHLDISWDESDKNTWLDLLFSHLVEPKLQQLTFVYDYPACQCALAKVATDDRGVEVAKRFEVFWKGLELANGYWELTDSEVQRKRFEQDLGVRRQNGLPLPEIDKNFMLAMESGLPECAGIALGVDRLLMGLMGVKSIDDVMTFPLARL